LQCPGCDQELTEDDIAQFYPGVNDKIRTVNRAPTAYSTQLLQDVTIEPDNSLLISNFQLVSEANVLQSIPYEIPRFIQATTGECVSCTDQNIFLDLESKAENIMNDFHVLPLLQ